MMEYALAIVLLVVVGALVFLWRRGALTIDKAKAKQETDEAWDHIQKDVRNWRDKLDKK